MSDEARPHEIIIIKRHAGAHEEGHHGGAWKIAYADFVTAMMAFFLVMWLISANDKTKAVIARYFNPVQLVDSTTQPPGLNDPKDKSSGVSGKEGKTAREQDTKAPVNASDAAQEVGGQDAAGASPKDTAKAAHARPKKDASEKDDAALFKDPYAVLGQIAARDATPSARAGVKAANEGTKGGAGAAASATGRGGDAYRDPFEPMTMTPMGTVEGAAESGRTEPSLPSTLPSAPATPAVSAPAASAQAAAEEPSAAPLPTDPGARAAALTSRIDALMKAVAASSSGPEPKVEVKATSEGVLVGLTDDAKFSMFASASAEPSPRTVTLMEKIGKLLKGEKGRLVVRGFTDARPYKSDIYDNWRLSSARADVVRYMLVRGGIDDARFERIEGYADRQPRNPKDPEGAENRRIEILLRGTP